MDSPTQGLLGAVTAQLGFRQRIGRDASWAAMAAAILPDADVMTAPALALVGIDVDRLTGLRVHRGITHSVVMAPFFCLAMAWLWWVARRFVLGWRARPLSPNAAKPQPKAAGFWMLYGCLLAAAMTHPLLDACTAYGTQLFAPFASGSLPRRYAWNCIAIIDFIYTPLLALTLLACWIVRKARVTRHRLTTLVIAIAGFALSTGYLCAGRLMHNLAVERTVNAAVARGVIAGHDEVVRADAYPMIGTIFLWRGVIETPNRWVVARVHHFGDDSSIRMSTAQKHDGQWVRRAMQRQDVQTFLWFTMGQARAEHLPINGGHMVRFHDIRYSRWADSLQSLWTYGVLFDEKGQALEAGFQYGFRGRRLGGLAGDLWHDIWNP